MAVGDCIPLTKSASSRNKTPYMSLNIITNDRADAIQAWQVRFGLHGPASDAILARAQASLRASGRRELGLLACRLQEGVLELRGQVSSFYLKQLAQEAVKRLHGVEAIMNAVEVVAPDHPRRATAPAAILVRVAIAGDER